MELRMRLTQHGQFGHQALRRVKRQHAKAKTHDVVTGRNGLDRFRHLIDGWGDERQQSLAVAIHCHCLVAPGEQRLADESLERLQPAAKCWRRKRELFGSGFDRSGPRHRYERFDTGE